MSEETVDFAPKPIRPLLTTGEFLRIVPVSGSTLDWLIRTRQLRAIRIKNKLFFAPDEVEKFLNSCSGAGDSQSETR